MNTSWNWLHISASLLLKQQTSCTNRDPPAELRTAYEALAHESQRQHQSLAELTRELQARDTGESQANGVCP